MRWLRSSSETPQLLGLSPLATDDSVSISSVNSNSINHASIETPSSIFRNQTPNHSTRKSRIDQSTSPSQPLSWSKKLTKSTENCYSIQQGRVIERGLKGRYISPVRIKNKNNAVRSTSPATQSITSIETVSTSTPTRQLFSCDSQTLNWRILQRDKIAANAFDADKSESNDDDIASRLSDGSGRFPSKLSRTIGGYSIPYREKRNPLSSTRLSCYKPLPDKKFDLSSLKNYKSVDDFLSLDHSDMIDADDSTMSMPFMASSIDLTLRRKPSIDESVKEAPKTNQPQDGTETTTQKIKKHGLSNKLRSMSDKTHKLFSKLYSGSNSKLNTSSSDVCNDFILQRPTRPPPNTINSRRSLSYGTLPGINEFEIKKIEAEDGDSGILVNESGASSMVETDSSSASDDSKTEIEILPESKESPASNERIEQIGGRSSSDDERVQPKNEGFDLSACRHSSSSDQILSSPSLSSFVSQRTRNLSMDALNETKRDEAPKRNSIVLELVAMIEKNETKFNTMKSPRRLKLQQFVCPSINPLTHPNALKAANLSDDDKIKLKSSQSKEQLSDVNDALSGTNFTDETRMKNTSNFCTLPRRTKASSHCTFLTVSFEKGPGKKSLGFTIVGGADSPRGALGIFIKSIMPNGQAIESGQLRAGDEILAVNGQVCHDLTHQSAVKMFKSVRSGEIVLNICRRKTNASVN